MYRRALALMAFLAAAAGATPLVAQVPDRFPPISGTSAAAALEGIACPRNVTLRFARSVGDSGDWRAYAILLCTEDRQGIMPIIGWRQQGGQGLLIPAALDGRIFQRPDENNGVQRNGHLQATVFGLSLNEQPMVCAVFRLNQQVSEPLAYTRCEALDQ